MRLCVAKGKKAIFHRWEQYRAIVEYEDGAVEAVDVSVIKFEDSRKLIDKLEKQVGKWENKNKESGQADENDNSGENPEDDGWGGDYKSDYVKYPRAM